MAMKLGPVQPATGGYGFSIQREIRRTFGHVRLPDARWVGSRPRCHAPGFGGRPLSHRLWRCLNRLAPFRGRTRL